MLGTERNIHKEFIKITIGGDICPIWEKLPYFSNRDDENIFRYLVPMSIEADFR